LAKNHISYCFSSFSLLVSFPPPPPSCHHCLLYQQLHHELPTWSPVGHPRVWDSHHELLSLSLLCKFLLPPLIADVSYHFFNRCLLNHQLNLLITIETLAPGELLLIPSLSSPCNLQPIRLHAECELLFIFCNIISCWWWAGPNLAQPKLMGLVQPTWKKGRTRFVEPITAPLFWAASQPKPTRPI